MSNPIELKNIMLGGIADSKFLGAKNSVASMVGFDIHSEPGILKVNQKLTKESGSTIDDLVKAIVPCSDGNTYLFGSVNGKIWERISDGTYTLKATAAPAAGNAGILDAKEFQGYIYYSMQNRLGRWQLGTAWSTRNDDWATFGIGDADFHPMREQNRILYIGDNHYLAQVDDAGVFAQDALTDNIKSPSRVKSLGVMSTDLLIGLYVSDNIIGTRILRWNTWSESFSLSDVIPEVGINSFLETDNLVIVNAGKKGNLYTYDGEKLSLYKKIIGDWTGTNKAEVNAGANFNFAGLPLFGLSNLSGNPALQGIYSLARHNRNYPLVLNLEYVISQNVLSNIEIGAIAGIGDIFLVSWKDTTSGTVYGVDKMDVSNKYSGAYLESRIMVLGRKELTTYKLVNVGYRSLPTSTTINIKKSVNYGAFGSALVSIDDIDRKVKITKEDIGDAAVLQLRVETTANGNNAPEIDNIILDV